jgi:hypothetical protein
MRNTQKKRRGRGDPAPVVQRPAQKIPEPIPELWFAWASIDDLPEFDA